MSMYINILLIIVYSYINYITVFSFNSFIICYYIKVITEKYHNNRVIGLQNIQISKKLIPTLMHWDWAITLMDTPGYFLLSLYILIPTIIFS